MWVPPSLTLVGPPTRHEWPSAPERNAQQILARPETSPPACPATMPYGSSKNSNGSNAPTGVTPTFSAGCGIWGTRGTASVTGDGGRAGTAMVSPFGTRTAPRVPPSLGGPSDYADSLRIARRSRSSVPLHTPTSDGSASA
jgi:hypothetical protein